MAATIERARKRVGKVDGSTGQGYRVVAGVCAACFVAGTFWTLLITEHVTVSEPPSGGGSSAAAQHAALERFYAWVRTTLWQQRASIVLVLIGLFAVVIARAVDALPSGSAMRSVAVFAGVAGPLVFALGNLIYLGGFWAVAQMSSHDNPIESVNVTAYTFDVTDYALEAAGSICLGVAMFVMAWAGLQREITLLLAAALLALGVSYLVDTSGTVTPWLQLAAGAVLLPAWVLLRVSGGDRSAASPG